MLIQISIINFQLHTGLPYAASKNTVFKEIDAMKYHNNILIRDVYFLLQISFQHNCKK